MEFNIIDILSVANKELTHSSIIKFLIDEKVNDVLEYFEIKDPNINCSLEESDSYKFENEKSKIRFDIVLKGSDKQRFAIFENKFKATPTIKQLENYDQYFTETRYEGKKILMVFCKEQIPSNVKTYCDCNRWSLKYYFNFNESDESERSLYQVIKRITPPFTIPAKTILFQHYVEYLEDYFENVKLLLDNGIPTKYRFNREFFSKYLMVIQGQISNIIRNKLGEESNEIIADNDGGSKPIPSIAFWFSFQKNIYNYISIDGNSYKIGFSYHKSEDNFDYLDNIFQKLEKNELISIYKGKKLNRKLKIGTGASVISLYSFDIRDWPHQEIATIASDLFVLYFNVVKNLN